MLSFLKISNLAILDDVSIEFGQGLNVLTGETGAGKSIIVDAIGLLLGTRGSADLVREGCDRLVVEAQFDLSGRTDAGTIRRLAGEEGDRAGDDLVIRRELTSQGRGRALVNGRLVAMSELKTLGEALADLHGQHQHQSLLRPEGQRDALDRCAGTLPLRDRVASLHGAQRALEAEREDLSRGERERARQEATLRREVEEIDAAAPRPAEDAELAREESLLRHAGEVARLAAESFSLLSDDDASAVARLAGAEERVSRLASIDSEADRTAQLLREARLAAAEAAAGLSRYLDAGEFEPARLEQVAARLAKLDRLKRAYGSTLEEVISYRDRAMADLEMLGSAPERLERLEAEIEGARAAYAQAARELSATRRKAAQRLGRAVASELRGMAMEGTQVSLVVDAEDEAAWGPHGMDRIEFLIAPNAGEGLRPLSRIASGGELSRLMLALRNASAAPADARTLIFDEVDSGVGGRVAETVGGRLAALARGQQILCVTHLPQIAACADRHFRISKHTIAGRTRAQVDPLDREGRVEELARMLGGSPPDTARRHAAALMGRRPRASAT